MSAPRLARLVPQTTAVAEEVLHISSFGIVRQGKKILLLRRRTGASAGKLTLPASLINYGEHPEDAMRRIIGALTGTKPSSTKLLDIQSYGDSHWDLCLIYSVEIPGVGTLPQDVEKAEYLDASDLPSDLREDHREVLQNLKQKGVL
jgi:ADP-ribose pyrophosphatase YjhB (NUDIX family)